MKLRRMAPRHSAVIGAGVAALTAAALTLPNADAAPTAGPGPLPAAAAGRLATGLSTALGDDAAGSYYDARTRTLVVNVVDRRAADRVRAAGAEPRLVRHSPARLDAARAELKARAAIPGTAWAMDPKANQVVVTADRTVTGARLAALRKVARGLGDTVRVRRSADVLRPLIAGGDAIWGDGIRCSLGFNVVKDGRPYFLTAGHCAGEVGSWSDTEDGDEIGTSEDSSFPGDDHGLVRYTADIDHPSEVDLYDGGTQPITRAGEATVGQRVRRSGSTSGLHDGEVTALDATVNYEEGTVEGLIQTTVCAEPGDSGGPLFAVDTALGLTSGGSGDCDSGGETFFQPVTEALAVYGAEIG
ncbi:streptogrisin [Streptomyces albus subsp. albus]|nr:streptogrisin [Streptomyces albus subsp. albus]